MTKFAVNETVSASYILTMIQKGIPAKREGGAVTVVKGAHRQETSTKWECCTFSYHQIYQEMGCINCHAREIV